MNTEELIEHLLASQSYPHPVELITTIETHISIVFLTGQYAYKLKKPVDFGFLDFSSLENRYKFCQLEVELNSRTAPELYLGVYQVIYNAEIAQIRIEPTNSNVELNANEAVVDYVVKMVQFNPNDVLGRLIKQDDHIELAMLEKLTSQIAKFHAIAQQAPTLSELGEPETLLQPMLDNFPCLFEFFKDEQWQDTLTKIEKWTQTRFRKSKPLLKQRKKLGFVRACHGDLHLDNIALIDNQPLLFDGIEFNETFRWIDVISDIAFLLIDIEFRGHKAASQRTLSLYLSRTLDYNALFLVNFYRVYRAMVRAKITTLRASQLPNDSLEQKQVIEMAQKYIKQTANYMEFNSQPKCILLQGISGAGKSYLADQMLEELGLNAITLNSDRIRKSLFGFDAHIRANPAQKEVLYSSEMNSKTYGALQNHAMTIMQAGFDVIVDATFLKLQHRQDFYKLCRQIGATPYVISIEVSPGFAQEAIRLRNLKDDNPSDADATVMQRQTSVDEKPNESENAIILNAADLRQTFPTETLQKFLELPLTDL